MNSRNEDGKSVGLDRQSSVAVESSEITQDKRSQENMSIVDSREMQGGESDGEHQQPVPGTSFPSPPTPTKAHEDVVAEEKKVNLPGTTTRTNSNLTSSSSNGVETSEIADNIGQDVFPVLPDGEPPDSATPIPPPQLPPEPSSNTDEVEPRRGVSFGVDEKDDDDDDDDDDMDVFDEEPEDDGPSKIESLSAKDLAKLASFKNLTAIKAKGKRKAVWLNPKGAVRAKWDAVVVFCILYNSIVLPLRITFGNADDLLDPLTIIDFMIDTLFITDIYLNFNTGFDDDGTVVMDAQIVRFHYLRTFFVIDLIATIPFDLLVFCFPDGRSQGDTRLYLRLPRLLRLLRLPRMFRYLNRWEDILPVNAVALRMFKLLFSVIMFAHMNACMQMLAAELQDFPTNSWATRAGVVHKSSVTKYSHAAFRALSHMLCIGYGQEPPYTIVEYWVVIFSMMLGACFYALLLGMMPTLMLSMDISGSLYTQKVDIWRQYFNYRGITKELRKRILNYFEYRWHTRKVFSEEDLLSELSTCLKTDIQMHVCEELIRKAPIFHALQPHIVTAVVSYLVPMKISEGEYVYNEGDISDSMYFIQSGEVSIESNEQVVFTTLGDGSYFGEFSFLYTDNRTRTACAKASKPTELFVLSQENFSMLTHAFPELLELLLNIADARTAIFMAQKEERDEMEMAKLSKGLHDSGMLPGIRGPDGGFDDDMADNGGESLESEKGDLDAGVERGGRFGLANLFSRGAGSQSQSPQMKPRLSATGDNFEDRRRYSGNGEKVKETKRSSSNSAMNVINKIKKRGLLSHITLNPGGEQAKLSMASTFAASQRLNQLQKSNTLERNERNDRSRRSTRKGKRDSMQTKREPRPE